MGGCGFFLLLSVAGWLFSWVVFGFSCYWFFFFKRVGLDNSMGCDRLVLN